MDGGPQVKAAAHWTHLKCFPEMYQFNLAGNKGRYIGGASKWEKLTDNSESSVTEIIQGCGLTYHGRKTTGIGLTEVTSSVVGL